MEPSAKPVVGPFEAGVVLGLLIGGGSFGGDGSQAAVQLKMHTRHAPLLDWVKRLFPYARLYGPYHHSGRHYYQLMWRGTQLQYGLMSWLESLPWPEIDPHSHGRYTAMKQRYGLEDVPPNALRLSGITAPSTAAVSPEPPADAESGPASEQPSPG